MWAWDFGVVKRLWPVELKKYAVASFWPPVAMETIQDGHQTQLLKSLKLQSHCMQIIFLFTVSTNIMLLSFYQGFVFIVLFLYFLVLFTFCACKNDINNISNRHKSKNNIAIHKSLCKSKDQYIYKQNANFQDYLYSKRSLGVKMRTWENAHEKKEKHHSYLIWIPLTFDKLYMLNTLCVHNKLLNGYKRY